MLPFKSDEKANERTREFLQKVIRICLDYIELENKRQEKVIHFYQPDEMIRMFDFAIRSEPVELEQLVEDCRQTLSHQVKTGKRTGTRRDTASEEPSNADASAGERASRTSASP